MESEVFCTHAEKEVCSQFILIKHTAAAALHEVPHFTGCVSLICVRVSLLSRSVVCLGCIFHAAVRHNTPVLNQDDYPQDG